MKRIFGVLFFLAKSLNAFSQEAAPIQPSNSTAAVQGAAANNCFNVDMYTGTLGVSIPIYTYSLDGLDLNVGLGYDARGIRVDQMASSVGLGWDVQAGGTVTREIYNYADNAKIGTPSLGWFYGYSRCETAQYDAQPDVYTATGPFGSFKFTVSPCVGGAQPLGVETIYPNRGQTVYIKTLNYEETEPSLTDLNTAFEVVDEKNNHYYYTPGGYDKRHLTNGAVPGSANYHEWDGYVITKWVLYRIVTHYDHEIRYRYSINEINAPSYKDVTITETEYRANDTAGGINVESKVVSLDGKEAQLARIEFPNGSQVLFHTTSGTDKLRCDVAKGCSLDSITITNRNSGSFIKYRFNYAYFNTPVASSGNASLAEIPYGTSCEDLKTYLGLSATTIPNGTDHLAYGIRLKLLGIDRVGADNSSLEPYYRFDYHALPLPYRIYSSRQDYFGYYNGKAPLSPASTSCMALAHVADLPIPKHKSLAYIGAYMPGCLTPDSVEYGIDRSDDITYAKACLLQKVTNATGGTAEFAYGQHSLINYTPEVYHYDVTQTYPDAPAQADLNTNDGVRIQSIVLKDGISDDNTKTIEYTYAGGQRFHRTGCYYVYDWLSQPRIKRVYKNFFMNPMPLYNGSNHGYSAVTVKTFGYVSQVEQTKHFFSNLVDSFSGGKSKLTIQPTPVPPQQTTPIPSYTVAPPYKFDQHLLGLPIRTEYYNADGSYLRAVLVDQYQELINGSSGSDGNNYSTPGYGNTNYGSTDYSSYRFFAFSTKNMRLAARTYYEYYAGAAAPVSTISTLTYNTIKRWQVELKETTDSRGRTTGANFIYAANDLAGSIRYRRAGSTTYYTGGEYSEDRTVQKKLLLAAPLNNGNAMDTNYMKVCLVNTVFDTVGIVKGGYSYAVPNNVLESYDPIGGQYTAAVWDTGTGLKLASVANARYQDIAYTSFESNYLNAHAPVDWNKGNWQFLPGNVIDISYANGYRSVTGNRAFRLNVLDLDGEVKTRNLLSPGQNYLLTVWANNEPRIYNGSQLVVPILKMQANGMKYYEAAFTGNNNQVKLVANQAAQTTLIDELRLYPAEASMVTTAHDPLFGPVSSCDERNNITRYEYDAFGRLRITRNTSGEIKAVTHTTIGKPDTNY